MSFNWNHVKGACCARWLVLPTVYSDALSYGEQLDKFCYQLNQLIANNNILPDFIAEMIKEYINSGAIGEVVRDILADYILNVKYPPEGITPAVGDGSADDTEAIQGCIDYASANGGVVYFPYGSYLTQPLTMKDGVSLFGFDRYSTKIVLKGGATKPLISGTVTGLSIANLTLDGNSGIQVNDVNVVSVMATDMLMTNLIIKDGYTLVNYYGTGGHFQISDVVFGNAVEKCLLTAGNANVQAENMVFNQLSAVGGICVLDIGTDGGYFNLKSVASCDKCIVVSGNENNIVAIVKNATTPVDDTGSKNNIKIVGTSNKCYYSSDVISKIDGKVSEEIAGNYSKTITGDTTIKENNSTTTSNGVTKNAKKFEFNSDEFVINTPKISYSNTEAYSRYFNVVGMKDLNENPYNILVETEKTKYMQTDYITPEYFGAVGDGVSDDTNALQNAVNYCHENGMVLKSNNGKTYLISSPIIFTNEWPRLNVVEFGSGVIKANNDMEACVIINGHANGGFISNIQIDCNSKNCIGLLINDSLHIVLDNIRINNIATLGVRVVAGYEILFSNTELWGVGSTATGFEINTSDSVYFNITGVNLHVGFSRTGPSNYFNHIHFWIADTVPAEAVQNSVLFKVVDNYCTFSNVESDTYHYTFQLNSEVIIIVNNLYFFISNNVINNDRTPGLTPTIFNCTDPKNTKSVYVNGCYGYGGPNGADHFCNTNFYGRAEGLTLIGFTDIVHENFIAALLPSYSTGVSALQGFATICGSTYELSLHLQLDNTVAGDKLIFTLPESCRPVNPIYGMCGLSAASYKVNSVGYLFIDSTSGNCTINIPELTGTVYATIHITFIYQNGAYSGQ